MTRRKRPVEVGYCHTKKFCYVSEERAWDDAELMQEKFDQNFYAYFHPGCCYYHVGRLQEENKK